MQRNKAFTLIELLVVIAIIAILAAILFPVFAQAKMAAKKTASISNMKQLALGVIMYDGDFDDVFPKNHYQALGTSIISLKSGATITNPEYTWAQVINPYTKNYQIERDPGNLVDPIGAWTGNPGGTGWWYNWTRWPSFGFNTTFLNPAPNCNWAPVAGELDFGNPISATAVNRPSNTVLFTTNKVVGSSTGAYESIDAEAPGGLFSTDSCDWSNGGWGIGSYGDSAGLYPGNPTSTGTFSTPYAAGGNVAWVDGSVKYQKPGALAAGTNWAVGKSNTAIQITDTTKYQWDYAN